MIRKINSYEGKKKKRLNLAVSDGECCMLFVVISLSLLMGCGKAFPLFKVTKWPWFVAWGVGGFFFLCWGGGNHVVFRWIVRGIMISRRLQSIWVGTIENWQSIYCQWRGGGERGWWRSHEYYRDLWGDQVNSVISWHNQIPLPLPLPLPLANTAINDWSRGESLSSERNCYYHFENIYQHFLLTFLRPRKWTLTSTSLVMNSGLKYVFLIGTTASSSSSSSLMHWGLTSMSSWFNSTFVLLREKLIKSADSSNSPHSVDRVGKE